MKKKCRGDLLSGIDETYVQEAADFLNAAPAAEPQEGLIPVRKKSPYKKVLEGALACAACAALVFGAAGLARLSGNKDSDAVQENQLQPGSEVHSQEEVPAKEPADEPDNYDGPDIQTEDALPSPEEYGLARAEIASDALGIYGAYITGVELENALGFYRLEEEAALAYADAILNTAQPCEAPAEAVFNDPVYVRFADGSGELLLPDAHGTPCFSYRGSCYRYDVPGSLTFWQLLGAKPEYSVESFDNSGNLILRVDYVDTQEVGAEYFEYEEGRLWRSYYRKTDGEVLSAEIYRYENGNTLPFAAEFYVNDTAPVYFVEELVQDHTEYYTYDAEGLISEIETVPARTEENIGRDVWELHPWYEEGYGVAVAIRPTECIEFDPYGYFVPEDQENWNAAIDRVIEDSAPVESCPLDRFYVYVRRGNDDLFVYPDGSVYYRNVFAETAEDRAPRQADTEAAEALSALVWRITEYYGIDPVYPDQIRGITEARLTVGSSREYTVTDASALKELEEIFRESAETYVGACWYDTILQLTLESGEVLTFSVSSDSWGEWLSDGAAFMFPGGGSKRFGRIFGFAVQNVAADAGIVYAADFADTGGFVSFESPQTAVYSFIAVNSEDAPWEIYVLDEPFTDAERYIPQAYACALTGDGSLLVEAGKWIYIHCPYNGFTGETAPEGCALSWTSIHA